MTPDRYKAGVQQRPTRPLSERPTQTNHDHASHSRRHFLQTAAGAGAIGALGVGGLLRPHAARAAGPGTGLAVPIPTTVDILGSGVLSHIQGGPGTDPSSVYNFRGASGIAFIDGTVRRRNRRTGEERDLPFLFNDMRFMQGVFKGHDGHAREATFGFV